MSKKLLGIVLVTGALFTAAPLVGLAEDTPATTEAAVQVSEAEGFFDKLSAAAVGTGARIKEVYQGQFGADARVESLKDVNKELRLEIVRLKDEITSKRTRDAVEMSQATSCLNTLTDYINKGVDDVK